MIRRIAKVHGLSVAEICGASRSFRIAPARFELYWAGVVAYGMSMPVIGRILRRDHTTVLHGFREVDAIYQATFGLAGAAALALPEAERREAIFARVAVMRAKQSAINQERHAARTAAIAAEAPLMEARE